MKPGSDEGFIVARTRLNTELLSDANDTTFSEHYRTSAGFRAQTIYNLPTAEEMNHWKLGKERSWRSSAFNLADVLTYRTEAWFDLAAEPHSEGFFKVIKKLRESADYRAGHKLRVN